MLLRLTVRPFPLEAIFWTGALVVLACTDPHAPPLLDLCLFKALGVPFCPGCGLGTSIALLFRGEVLASFQAHPLGGVSVVILASHILRGLYLARRPAVFSPCRSCRK